MCADYVVLIDDRCCQALLLGDNHALVCPPLPVSVGTIESHGERTLQLSRLALVAWLTAVGTLSTPPRML